MQTCRPNLYDITPEWVAETDPDLVVLLEVLEHVPSAEQALSTIARCIRPDAAIVFSLPVLGRLEACWGDVSMFDTARVRRMIASAGLIVQHVEAVHDTWQLVVVSPTNRVLPRLVGLASRPPAAPPEPPPSVPTFQASTLSSATQSRTAMGGAHAHMTKDHDGLHVKVTAPRERLSLRLGNHFRRVPRTAVAGVALPVAGDRTVRLELASPDGPPDSLFDGAVALAGGWTCLRLALAVHASDTTHAVPSNTRLAAGSALRPLDAHCSRSLPSGGRHRPCLD